MNHRQRPNSPAPTECPCIQCLSEVETFIWWMVVCDLCGNKRCPHSDDHRSPCTGSNETGQHGSRYHGEVGR